MGRPSKIIQKINVSKHWGGLKLVFFYIFTTVPYHVCDNAYILMGRWKTVHVLVDHGKWY